MILLTGHTGFIGKHLLRKPKQKDIARPATSKALLHGTRRTGKEKTQTIKNMQTDTKKE